MTTPLPPDPMVPAPANPPGQPPAAPTPRKPSSSFPIWFVVILVVLLIIILGCCGGFVTCSLFAKRTANISMEKIKEIAAQAPANFPANFPSDIPLYTGVTVVQSVADNSGDSGILSLASTDAIDPIAAFYRSNMPANGWTVGNDKSFTGEAVQAYTKNERSAAIIITNKNEDRTSIVITYSSH